MFMILEYGSFLQYDDARGTIENIEIIIAIKRPSKVSSYMAAYQ